MPQKAAVTAIPEELRLLPQWIVWRYEDKDAPKPTKVPYDPKTSFLANVTKPETWTTFEEAFNTLALGGYDGLGFVFTDKDPYTFIDLDAVEGPKLTPEEKTAITNRQLHIYKEFNSYSEISPSGKGLHIIIKGTVPTGRRRSYIEVYSSDRYATMTGNVYNAAPIEDRQAILTQLWEQMGSGERAQVIYAGTDKEPYPDDEIIRQALAADNGEKFRTLFEGRWQDLYSSQSEADFAFIDILAFYTQNRKQIERIFHNSKLGLREKAKRKDYVLSMVNRSFDRILPHIDFDGFKNEVEAKLTELKTGTVKVEQRLEQNEVILPPGLMGELAQFIYAAAPRPVKEIALAGAIGLMAGVCGRAYNISNTGLNHYVLVLAKTGSGKEGMTSGIDRLMNAIRFQVPTSSSFIGPAEINSHQALVKHLNKSSQCFVSILGEFGLRLQAMSSQNASPLEIGIRRVLLDLYNKSGHNQIFRPSIYSDRDKNIAETASPAFSILGESTPERFYGALNEDMISEGLLPRFLLIEYNGPRVPLNKSHANAQPSFQLIERLASLVAMAEQIMHAKRVVHVQSTPEATTLHEAFDKHCDKQINATNKEVVAHLWNRAHMKVLRLSALIAVGVNMADPIILPEYVRWAINMVQSDIKALSIKFEAGEIGQRQSSENRQVTELVRVINDYLTRDWSEMSKYKTKRLMHYDKVVPYSYLNRRLIAMAAFRNDKIGATNSLKRTIQILIDSGKLREINRTDLQQRYGTAEKTYAIDPGLMEL